jgi:CIC family chloride channel protein
MLKQFNKAYENDALKAAVYGASPIGIVVMLYEGAIKAIMTAIDETGADELAVVDEGGEVIGLITEAHVTRRYAEELEKARRELTGDTA